ncbi:hypothetical protein Bsp3421_002558 [Burkholderia sp. FERM BP-3421]|uniref:hypothetical protein n=1 Tax=Burkholderia sp. FERM BP-3421 TaxID=1494466 RepID=UPI00235E6540|nr:hypothetical protein [Burkholderia sp. FERM BP-3421]WDD92546.1 hypothetical protein Bsp3421_002558 [Burkholderia sp. FERM BP-3421]
MSRFSISHMKSICLSIACTTVLLCQAPQTFAAGEPSNLLPNAGYDYAASQRIAAHALTGKDALRELLRKYDLYQRAVADKSGLSPFDSASDEVAASYNKVIATGAEDRLASQNADQAGSSPGDILTYTWLERGEYQTRSLIYGAGAGANAWNEYKPLSGVLNTGITRKAVKAGSVNAAASTNTTDLFGIQFRSSTVVQYIGNTGAGTRDYNVTFTRGTNTINVTIPLTKKIAALYLQGVTVLGTTQVYGIGTSVLVVQLSWNGSEPLGGGANVLVVYSDAACP